MDYQTELDFTKILIQKAGEMILEMQQKAKITFKATKDIVTEADLACEKLIIDSIQQKFPHDKIISEENYKDSILSEERTWVIDPIDGTVNYLRGIPLYGISIALVKNKAIQLGCVYLPEFKELYWAVKNQGAFCNDDKIAVSKIDEIGKSVLHFGDSHISPVYEGAIDKSKAFLKITKQAMRSRLLGCAVIEGIYVATGKIEGYACDAFFWDFAATKLLVEEAGGKVTRDNGDPYHSNKRDAVLSNGKIHDKLLALLKNS